MTVYSDKVKYNKKALKALNPRIKGGKLFIDGEELDVDLIVKEVENAKKEKKTLVTVDHEEFPQEQNVIRLYLPIMGASGYVPTEDEIIELFKGNSIYPPEEAFVNFKSATYSIEKFDFRPLAEMVHNGKVSYYGEGQPTFKSDS